MIVVDASVAAKWYLPEEGRLAAKALVRESAKLVAPSLLRLEVAAAITCRMRLGSLTIEEAQRACELWFAHLSQGLVALIPYEPEIPDAVLLALQVRHALQDCVYLAVARRLNVPLITADRVFAARAGEVHPSVQLLTDLAE